MKRLVSIIALTIGLTLAAHGQQQWPGDSTYTYSLNAAYTAQTFVAASVTGATIKIASGRSGIIEINGTGPSAAVAAPVITGTTTSIATYTVNASGDSIGGTIAVSVATLGSCTVTIPAYTTLAGAVTLFNAAACATTTGLTASTTSATLVLTQGGVSLAISNNGSALTDYKAWTSTWSIQGSVDGGVTWFSLPTAVMPTTSVPITTTALTQATAVTTQAGSTYSSFYVVNLVGLSAVRFTTTSSSFTATGITPLLALSRYQGYL